MTLSVLSNAGAPNKWGVWSTEEKSFIFIGEYKQAWAHKDQLEKLEQERSNARDLEKVREARLQMLVSAGLTTKDAHEYLKKHMPFLYPQQQTI